MTTTTDPTAIYTNRPTVILDRGARHIANGDMTLCGWYPINDTRDVRFPATLGQRISCAACAASDS